MTQPKRGHQIPSVPFILLPSARYATCAPILSLTQNHTNVQYIKSWLGRYDDKLKSHAEAIAHLLKIADLRNCQSGFEKDMIVTLTVPVVGLSAISSVHSTIWIVVTQDNSCPGHSTGISLTNGSTDSGGRRQPSHSDGFPMVGSRYTAIFYGTATSKFLST